jgi:mannose/cellobiose epimerase-like protein (N-acyl-D-glucosamine 2-epimerase family)
MAVDQVYGPAFAGLTASAKAAASPPKRRAKAEAMRHVSHFATSSGADGGR